MNHPAKHAGGVLDRFATAELDLAGGEEESFTTQFSDADLKADPGPGRGLGEEKAPALSGQRFGSLHAPSGLELLGQIDGF